VHHERITAPCPLPDLKFWLLVGLAALIVPLNAIGKSKEKNDGPIVELPTFVVIGTRIPSGWLEVAYECTGPSSLWPIKRAWISKVGQGTPAEDSGLKVGDTLLSFDDHPTAAMTGESLHDTLRREHSSGTLLKMIVQTKGAEKRTVAISFN
jgi:hypothetical protein